MVVMFLKFVKMSVMKKTITKSEAQTLALGKKIARSLKGGETIALVGDLGAGKTVLARGLARGLGVKNVINSPTFVLMKLYRTPINADQSADKRGHISVNQRSNQRKSAIRWFVHIDAYRLNSGQCLIDIGILDWLGRKDSIVLIEWAERVKDILPKKAIKIKIKIGKSKNTRLLNINL